MATNGRLASTDLSPIAGGGYLRKDAAAAWNTMAAKARKRGLGEIAVKGPDSAYRVYARQVYWRTYWCNRGMCYMAAVPGTSNHGWGVAVDVDARVAAIIAQIGAEYGWDRACSDAKWEAWHHKWCGGWSGSNPGTSGRGGTRYPTLRKGSKRTRAVRRAQRHLRRWNLGLTRPKADGNFGRATKKAVKQFQWVHGLKPDGVIGKNSWLKLRESDPLTDKERTHVNRLRHAQRNGVKAAEKDAAKRNRVWLVKRLDQMKRDGRDKAWWWRKNHRRRRFRIIRRTVNRTWR
jgi:hypothetical protein